MFFMCFYMFFLCVYCGGFYMCFYLCFLRVFLCVLCVFYMCFLRVFFMWGFYVCFYMCFYLFFLRVFLSVFLSRVGVLPVCPNYSTHLMSHKILMRHNDADTLSAIFLRQMSANYILGIVWRTSGFSDPLRHFCHTS